MKKKVKEVKLLKGIKGNDSVRNMRKVFVTISIVLLYVLAVLSGLYQELTVYTMDLNVSTSKKAETIIEDPYAKGSEVLEGVERVELKAPRGTGNYVAIFGEDDVWVVSEMSTWESVDVLILFTALDCITYIITLILISTYYEKHTVGVFSLAIYQVVFLIFAWVVDAYCWGVLFDMSWVSHLQTLLRSCILILSLSLCSMETDRRFV